MEYNNNIIDYIDSSDDSEYSEHSEQESPQINKEQIFNKNIIKKAVVIDNMEGDDKFCKYTINFGQTDPRQNISPDINLTQNQAFNNVIGFTIHEVIIYAINKTPLSPDRTEFQYDTPYIDIIIDELPMIACFDNNYNNHIACRVVVRTLENQSIIHYEPELHINNYFIPITIDKLTISLRDFKNEIIQHNEHYYFKIALTIELTMINNLNEIE